MARSFSHPIRTVTDLPLALVFFRSSLARTVDVVRLHEAAIVGRPLPAHKAVHRLAREDLKKAKASGKSVTVCIGWEKDLAMHRLDLGKIHLEAALAEALCKCRQQEYCSAGFRAGHGLQDDRFRRGRGADSRI